MAAPYASPGGFAVLVGGPLSVQDKSERKWRCMAQAHSRSCPGAAEPAAAAIRGVVALPSTLPPPPPPEALPRGGDCGGCRGFGGGDDGGDSSSMVTGPSLMRLTCIFAPNSPVATGPVVCSPSTRCTKSDQYGLARCGPIALWKSGLFPLSCANSVNCDTSRTPRFRLATD
jgi:hypothetical protein